MAENIPVAGLGDRGRAFWERFKFDADSPEGVLALEGARVVDSVDRLHEWEDHEDADQARLRKEIRESQALLRQMIATIVALTDDTSTADPAAGRPKPAVKSAVDEFTARRRAREGGSA